jgi:outer membrane receptor protein involved in Fe transport
VRAWALAWVVAWVSVAAVGAQAASTGKIQGRVVATDTGEALGFADVMLLPADTTMRQVGCLTNADGTFLLEATPGRYALRVRALSYASKAIEGIVIEEGKLLPFNTAITPEAIVQKEIVVEARARQNNELSMLAARKKAAAVGDAVSAEQVGKSPDKDAAEVLRRVTGLSVADGKYVFVRGLGERYSSTEVDGVRIASPEQNKRVVPLDLLPANLLENIVVQKTYTADRPGEFGGGDVQVHTKDFPGNRTWSFSALQGYVEGVTFNDRLTYASTGADLFGFGAHARRIPDAVFQVAGDRPLVNSSDPARGFTLGTLASVAKSFNDVWSPHPGRTIPNASYSTTYGDEFRLFGHPLGLVESWSLSRSFDRRDETQRFFMDKSDTLYDYAVSRSKETVQLGGISGLSYRLSPRHTLHLRGLYTHGADDEVRVYEGPDHNRTETTTGGWLNHRGTRLMYVERNVLSGTLEGQHEFAHLLGTSLDWKLTRSQARRLQPDRRETTYDLRYYDLGNGELVSFWLLGSVGSREYGDLRDDGHGASISGSLPYRLGPLGKGKIAIGYDRQTKARENFYRRFNIYPNELTDRSAPPESIFSGRAFDGQPGSGYVEEATLDVDNYVANQRLTAGYLSVDLPLGRHARSNLGVRAEHGFQEVRSFDLFDRSRITAEGKLDDTDWLPSGNLTVSVTEAINLRLGASRTLSRPDLNELSPSPALEYVGGLRVSGNPDLKRAAIDNYDVRLEAFPGLSEVFAAGFFYKRLHEPIEQVIQGGSPPILVPRNSDRGRNSGLELEARSGLGRLWSRLARFSLNANASFISSSVLLNPQLTVIGTGEHPLQGQASYLVNGALSYASAGRRTEMTVLVSATGQRLYALGLAPLPDIYERPTTSLDATMNFAPFRNARVKLGARNLLDRRVQQLQGRQEVSGYRTGRSYSIGLSYGS